MDLNAILNGQADISANVQRAINEVNGTVQRAAYDNLSETRDVQASLSRDTAAIQSTLMSGFANQKDCCCQLSNQIDSVKYENALNTASINSNIDSKFAALEKGQLEAQIAAQQNQINQLSLQQAMCGVPRINPYFYSVYPNYGGCGCGGYTGTSF